MHWGLGDGWSWLLCRGTSAGGVGHGRWHLAVTLAPSQAAQNLIVLAREEPGAEKIFQSDGVRLLQQLLEAGEADTMLAALRTLVGLCSGHRSRVGPCATPRSPIPSAVPGGGLPQQGCG